MTRYRCAVMMPAQHSEAAKFLGQRIRKMRRARSCTLEDLGELAELAWMNIAKIERGEVSPSVETVVRIATALDVDPGDLLKGMHADMFPGRTHKFTARDLTRARKERKE